MEPYPENLSDQQKKETVHGGEQDRIRVKRQTEQFEQGEAEEKTEELAEQEEDTAHEKSHQRIALSEGRNPAEEKKKDPGSYEPSPPFRLPTINKTHQLKG